VGSATMASAVMTGGSSAVVGSAAAALQTGRAGLLAAQSVRGGISGAHAARASTPGQSLLTRARTTLAGAAQGASAAVQASALTARVGSYAGATTRVAAQQTRQTLRQFADVARYIGQDHPGPGVRR